MTRKRQQSQTLLEVWPILRRYPWQFLLPAFSVTVLILGGALFLPHKYKAEATLERRTDTVLREIANRGAPANFQDPRASMYEELDGETAVDELVTKFYQSPPTAALRSAHPDRDALRTEILRKTLISPDIATNDIDRIRVSFITEDPDLACYVVNNLVQNYINRTRKILEERMRESTAFFRNEVDHSRRLVEELENKKLTFEIQHTEVLMETAGTTTTGVTDPRSQLAQLQQQRNSLNSRINSLRETLEATPKTSPTYVEAPNPELVQMENKLRDLNMRLVNFTITLKMTEKHPDVISLREEIAHTQNQMEQLPKEVIVQTQVSANAKRTELEVMLTNALAEQRSLNEQLELFQARLADNETHLANIFPIRSEYLKLTRDVDQAHRQAQFWEDNLRRVDMAKTIEAGNRGVQLDFIKPAGPITRPTSPNLYQVVLAAVVLGLLAGGASLFIAYRADETFRRGEHLAQYFHLPLVGTVGELLSDAQQQHQRFRKLCLYPINFAAMAVVLIFLTSLLYLDLQKPDTLDALKHHPGQYLVGKIGLKAAHHAGDIRE